jgi:RNA polymerase sigma factor (TIGR02999 family)
MHAAAPEGEGTTGEVTQLLGEWSRGDRRALDRLLPLAYHELRETARGFLNRERPGHTLQATSLVHELYLRLLKQRKACWNDRKEFYRFAAYTMRNILIDHARGGLTARRGAGAAHLPLTADLPWVDVAGPDFADLTRALDELDELDPRKARIVELRFFLGCTMPEAADILDISVATAERDFGFARVWLAQRLRPPQ